MERGRAVPVGLAHEECADDVERAIADGGCNAAEYWRIYGDVMSAE